MKLADNEVIVKDSVRVLTGVIGCEKTKREVMLSFTKTQDTFDYVDVFLTKEQAIKMAEKIMNLWKEQN